ncbi:CRISPR-associated endonuclease Cas2 [Oxynema sp. CENA135]|jgi:CRISPR-associated protein Cas2|uniref:CRISPR-associated endonuclease Cas2 n=1 Tax=Oxynema sp. CENA135 TaxID=984206 RepID=UPI00190A856B|nr:CRISPR-associated endonuclease Cas2 [Oxynema sp. CENA135]MBK4728557.1 CRISPR-associated endonuclease Cas2 [Oxynema sp. CENA135]
MLLYVIVYDLPDNKRRQKIHDLLEGYGQWVQYSTFECWLSSDKYAELQKRLRCQLNLDEDSIRFYPLSRHTVAQVETWGIGPPLWKIPGSTIV